jgi:hypothetical protein
MQNKYFNEYEVAYITGLSVFTLRSWRSQSRGMPYVKVGASIRYNIDDVEAFMHEHKINPETIKVSLNI